MTHTLIKPLRHWISLTTLLVLCGCSSMMSSRMPASHTTMARVYQQAISGTTDDQGNMTALRQKVVMTAPSAKTMQTASPLVLPFASLPNPPLTMYVYGHYVHIGDEQLPIPAYTTVFSLYTRNYYTLPIQ